MKDKAFVGASLLAAVVASFCCILPLVFAVGGFAVIGASAFFESLRPYLLAATFGLLAVGFYFAYRKPKLACEPGSACEHPKANRSGRVGLWTAAVLVVLFSAFPHYSAPVARLLLLELKAQAASPQRAPISHVSFAVEGMTCPVCAQGVEHKLKQMPGVQSAAVSYDQRKAEIEYDHRIVPVEQLEKVFQDAGYRVHGK